MIEIDLHDRIKINYEKFEVYYILGINLTCRLIIYRINL